MRDLVGCVDYLICGSGFSRALTGIADVAGHGPFVAEAANDPASSNALAAAALLSAADKALYRAKSDGRDGVCSYGPQAVHRADPSCEP